MKKKLASYALRENFNIFIAREARARARSAPEDTNKRLRTIYRKPDGRRTFGQKGSRRVPECKRKKKRLSFELKVMVTQWVAYLERVRDMRHIRRKTRDFEQLAIVDESSESEH